jgi:hypothetical protein
LFSLRHFIRSPMPLHLEIQERGSPGNEHQAGQRLDAGQVSQVANWLDITKAQCGKGGEGEIAAVHQTSIEVSFQSTPAFRTVHKIVGKGKDPDLDRVGNQGSEDAEDDPVAMRELHFWNEQGDPVQELVMQQDSDGDDQAVYQEYF